MMGALSAVIGAKLLVNKGIAIARAMNILEAIIGLTIVGVETSLPELVTNITALIKNNSNLSLDHIINVNILNILLVIPGSALIPET